MSLLDNMKFWSRTISMASILSVALIAAIPASHVVSAQNTGGYPWANASLIRSATYDWGYTRCQIAMRRANMCEKGHTSYKFGVKYFQSDPWHYDVRNCTSYVAWRVHREHGKSIFRWGNASNWAYMANLRGFRVDTKPSPGSIAWWPGRMGHVAYVTKINKDKSVSVDQYNKAGRGEFSRQNNVRAVKYIHIGRLRVKPVVDRSQSSSVAAKPRLAKKPTKIIKLDPLSPNQAADGLPEKEGISYSVALDPVKQVTNVYAVQFQATKSGHLEVSKSNFKDGNTTWEKTWTTSIKYGKTRVNQDNKYILADSNNDQKLDLFIVDRTDPKKSKVTILSGAKQFTKVLHNWSVPDLSQESVVSVSDYNGDGHLDLYSFEEKSTKSVAVKVMDGSEDFSQVLIETSKKSQSKTSKVTDYMVSDHDRDGKNDIIQVIDSKSQLQISVFSPLQNEPSPITSWETGSRLQKDEELSGHNDSSS